MYKGISIESFGEEISLLILRLNFLQDKRMIVLEGWIFVEEIADKVVFDCNVLGSRRQFGSCSCLDASIILFKDDRMNG